jgi:ATP-dependent RNA helicase DDX19/DBP5
MSSDAKPATTEPDAATLSNLNISSDDKPDGPDPRAASFEPKPAGWKWADEDNAEGASDKKAEKSSDVEKAQTDGATEWLSGSSGLDEPEFDVNVKLADLQEDPNNPLYSVKSFDALNL